MNIRIKPGSKFFLYTVLTRLVITLSLLLACTYADSMPAQERSSTHKAITFNQHIRPILSEHCFACHGPDETNREAGLRLDQSVGATALLDSGIHAIVPHKVGQSEVIARTTSQDADLVMPPPSAKLGRLSSSDVSLLKQWIADGAIYEPHWAFVPPVKPKLIPADIHPIDGIISRHLNERGLQLQQKANRATLIRRQLLISLDFHLRQQKLNLFKQILHQMRIPSYLTDSFRALVMAKEWHLIG